MINKLKQETQELKIKLRNNSFLNLYCSFSTASRINKRGLNKLWVGWENMQRKKAGLTSIRHSGVL